MSAPKADALPLGDTPLAHLEIVAYICLYLKSRECGRFKWYTAYVTYEFIVRLLADGLVVVIVLVGAGALLAGVKSNQRHQSYTRIIMAGLTALFLARFIASIYQPDLERPFEVLGQAAGASYLNNPGFPSDHALFAMTITLAVWFETKYKKLAISLFVLTIIMSVGRVLALVHTPLDVIGGMIIAVSGVIWYVKPLKKQHQNTRSPKVQH